MSKYEQELQELEYQDYVLTPLNDTSGKDGEELRLLLSVVEQDSVKYEDQKTNLYNVLMSEMLACVDAYTEIRYIQAYRPDLISHSPVRRLAN